MTVEELRSRVHLACVAAGSRRAFAKENGLSPAYLGEFLSGTRGPGPLIMKVMGVRRRVVYELEPVDPGEFA